MQNNPKPYELYRHFKGMMYQVLNIAENSEDGSKMVVYQQLYSPYKVYCRPYEMFISLVDRQKYPNATQMYRFQLVDINDENQTEAESVRNMQTSEDSQAVEEPGISENLMRFLDADSYERKLEIMSMMHADITQEEINTMAASLDVEVESGDLETRYGELKTCLVTLERFECNRLR